MNILVKQHERTSNDTVRSFVEHRVARKLSRMSRWIRSIAVSLRDVNGPRGGIDHTIQVIVRLKSGDEVVIRHQAIDVSTGMPVAMDRTIQAVTRELKRRRSMRRQSSRPKFVAPEPS